jgi:hypothetical protein
MDKFMLCPLLAGYSFTPGQNILEQQLAGGMPRQRRNFIGSVGVANVSVFCRNELEIEYFWAFWRKKDRNPQSWLWALKTDSYKMEEHECRFMLGQTPQESERQGNKIKYSFQVWVKPLNRSASYDDDVVDAWQLGINPDVSNALEVLVNVTLPNALENV